MKLSFSAPLEVSVLFILILSNLLWAQCPVSTGTEYIVNGDFSAGNTGFTNDFAFFAGPGTLPQDAYAVTTNPNNFNSGYFKSMGDHTTGTGNMLIFDFVNNSVNDAVYRTTVPVVNGQTYFFSAWFANIAINNTTPCAACPGGQKITNPPILKFRIAGVDIATISVDSITNNWNQYFTPYKATTTGNITIEIINIRGGIASNDLALDDISFSNSCSQISNLNEYGRRTELTNTLNACNVGFPYQLTTNRSASNYNFRWLDESGVTIAGQTNPNYTISTAPVSPTKYIVCYDSIADGIAGCWKKDTVVITNSPLTINLGPDITMCAPINATLNSGLQNPPVDIQWRRNGTILAGQTAGTLQVTEPGTYRVDASRSGCGTANDEIIVGSPVSSFSGSGTYCETNNTASFSVTGATEVKWFTTATGGTELNPGNTNPSISLAHTSTVTTVPGCESGLYAQDVGSYPATVMSTQPCSPTAPSNTSSRIDLMIDVSQTTVLQSVDFFHNPGWGTTGTFTFTLSTNNPTGGPYCGSCSPAGNKDGVGTAIYSEVSPSYTVGASAVVRTMTLTTPQSLTPGRYWLSIQATGTALGDFTCNRALNSNGTWSTPLVDNSGNSIISAGKAIKDNNTQGSGGLFNIKFQVGSVNACQRLFICANRNCPTPVDFANVSAEQDNGRTTIKWEVMNEFEVDKYIIEASENGTTFFPVSQQKALNQSGLLKYSSTVELVNYTYFRVKQVDLGGGYSYSSAVFVTTGKNEFDFSVYPNPARLTNEVKLILNQETEGEVQVVVKDISGKLVKSITNVCPAGKNELKLGNDFGGGFYVVELFSSVTGAKTSQKLFIY